MPKRSFFFVTAAFGADEPLAPAGLELPCGLQRALFSVHVAFNSAPFRRAHLLVVRYDSVDAACFRGASVSSWECFMVTNAGDAALSRTTKVTSLQLTAWQAR